MAFVFNIFNAKSVSLILINLTLSFLVSMTWTSPSALIFVSHSSFDGVGILWFDIIQVHLCRFDSVIWCPRLFHELSNLLLILLELHLQMARKLLTKHVDYVLNSFTFAHGFCPDVFVLLKCFAHRNIFVNSVHDLVYGCKDHIFLDWFDLCILLIQRARMVRVG